MAESEKFDVLIIGSGTSGTRLALEAAKAGKKTAVVEYGVLGGTCLNTGCIPTKAMLHAAHLFTENQDYGKFGLKSTTKVDFSTMMKRVHSFITTGREHIIKSFKKYNNLKLYKGKAEFVNANTVQVNKDLISSDKIIVCTGAKNMTLPIPGLDKIDFLDNEATINLKKFPKSVITIGGGYIAMEFATFFADLGCKVTVLERMPKILNMLDDDVLEVMKESYDEKGVTILNDVNILEVGKSGNQKYVLINDVNNPKSKKKKITAECILLAAGRVPNTDGLNLEKAGIKTGTRKNIEVNDFLETSNPFVYAMGDVTGRAMFAHSAKREAKLIKNMLLNNEKKSMNFDLVPWAVFTDPVVAGVGLSEKNAIEKKINYGILKSEFSNVGRAAILNDTDGFAKVIYDKNSKLIIGCVIVGCDADNLIHEFVALMHCKATIDTLKEIIHVHPTLAEVFEGLE